MKTSTLRPGQISPDIKKLRDAALKEMDAPGENERSKGAPTFDQTHDKTRDNDSASEDFDRNNGVANYPGQNVEHIGNGTGGVRR